MCMTCSWQTRKKYSDIIGRLSIVEAVGRAHAGRAYDCQSVASRQLSAASEPDRRAVG